MTLQRIKEKKRINRLILLGNGFDLAHQLKTTYNDFILWYLIESMEQAHVNQPFEDELLAIYYTDWYGLSNLSSIGLNTVPRFVNYFYKSGLLLMLKGGTFNIPRWNNDFSNPFQFKLKSELLKTLLFNCSDANWVDIENIFYEKLKSILKSHEQDKNEEIAKLNHSLKLIIELLERYLSTLDVNANTATYREIIETDFNPNEFVGLNDQEQFVTEIGHTMILNFNYTSTIENYIDDQNIFWSKITVNYIHGKLGDDENRPIFGFGDELDQEYANFELDKTKGIFEYIKSFWYFKTSNYHNLIRFIDSSPYQVYTLGHSCGLSDRTMLNMILEHGNCKSVKIFYHQKEDSNDYTKLTQEISRHFKNKQDMRRKIVPFNMSSPMPQVHTELTST